MTWREKARPIIAAVIQEHGTDDMQLLRRKLREAFPWGPRQHWPYKIWLNEIGRQLNPTPSGRRLGHPNQFTKPPAECAGQLPLFDFHEQGADSDDGSPQDVRSRNPKGDE